MTNSVFVLLNLIWRVAWPIRIVEHWGGWPLTTLVYQLLNRGHKLNKEFFNKYLFLHIQAICCPVMLAIILHLIYGYFGVNSIIFITVFATYCMIVNSLYYIGDQYVEAAAIVKQIDQHSLMKKLRRIRIHAFMVSVFLLVLFFPL